MISFPMSACLCVCVFVSEVAIAQSAPHRIQIVDASTGRGVPLVELETVNHVRWVTDSNGIAAIDEPGLFDKDVFFYVQSHGYEFPADGFGYRGRRTKLVPGGETVWKIERRNIAERMYRVTGHGIYRDSVLVGAETPIPAPLLNADVFGSDSVMTALFRGKIHWFWGDTSKPNYPLGIFNVPGAVSELPERGGLEPGRGVALNYFTDENGAVRDTCRMPGKGPTWIDGLLVVTDEQEHERMFAKYVKVEPPLTVYERGLAEFDADAGQFRQALVFPKESELYPAGHPIAHADGQSSYFYFAEPFPWVRVRATVAAVTDLATYECYSCLERDSDGKPRVVRDDEGRLVYEWKRDGLPLTPDRFDTLRKAGALRPDENPFRLQARGADTRVQLHAASSIAWNPYRDRWTMIALEKFGTSVLGELWYAESEQLAGPWSEAIKIVSHDKYSFYNPKQHPLLSQENGRYLYFEGTYTTLFSGNNHPTPRYDYNQIMYQLDLSDPRLALD